MSYVSRLLLHHFRNYLSLQLELEPTPIVITGPNGAGKTNILEAVSFLSPGKGLRGVALTEIDYQKEGEEPLPWAVAATVHTDSETVQIGTGRDSLSAKRIVKVDGHITRGHTVLSSYLSVIWLTPQMDLLFMSGSGVRRKFLDRLVYHFDPEHAERVVIYEQAMRERAKLLKEGSRDDTWFSVLEERMAAYGVAIAASRLETVERIMHASEKHDSPFPKAHLMVEGEIEQMLGEKPALEVEERFRAQLAKNRGLDAKVGRTNTGVHRSDLIVSHAQKQRPAASCSTGEQKSLLLSIVLAHIRARIEWRHLVPLILLDEVVAHLDEFRRAFLLEDLLKIGAQVWLTGTDEAAFAALKAKAQFLRVEQGRVQ